jgi:Protein of unknown function (DUF5132)
MAKKSDISKTLGPAVKPLAKAILQAGLSVYDAAEQHVAEARELLMDFVTEVREETNGGVKRKASSKKTFSRRGKNGAGRNS